MAIVYGLVDPRDNNLFYIGITTGFLDYRLKYHMRETRITSAAPLFSVQKKMLIEEITKCGKSVLLVPLLRCHNYFGREAEYQAYMFFTMLGFNLLQSSTGFNWLGHRGQREHSRLLPKQKYPKKKNTTI